MIAHSCMFPIKVILNLKRAVGIQSGGRVFLFLHINDFWRDYKHIIASGVVFDEEPRVEEYGTVVVFQDLYGNKWDLLQSSAASE